MKDEPRVWRDEEGDIVGIVRKSCEPSSALPSCSTAQAVDVAVGNVLDQWDSLGGDTKAYPELESLRSAIEQLNAAVQAR